MLRWVSFIGYATGSLWEPRYTWADELSQATVDEEKAAQLDRSADESERNITSACGTYSDCVDKFRDARKLWDRLYSLKVALDRRNRLRRHFDKAGDVMERINVLEQDYLEAASEYRGKR